jgi:hypothetical protein
MEDICKICPVPQAERDAADCSTVCGAVRAGINWQKLYEATATEFLEVKANLRKMTDNYNAILKQCAHLRQALAERENYIASLQKFTSEVQVKAVKEFAEKLKEKTGTSFDYYEHFQKVVLSEQIDELLKEYEK